MSNAITEYDEIQNRLERIDFKSALPKHIEKDKFIKVVMTAIVKEPSHPSQDLMKADRRSLLQATMFCAEDGLLPNGKEAAFVVRGGKVVYMPMIAGILKKMRNSGNLKWIDAIVVYENDEYSAWTDENGHHFKHVPVYKDRGNPLLTYAAAITLDGGNYFETITEEQMDKIEAVSGTAKIWKGPFRDEMKRKSALRRLSKRMPSSSDIENILHRDDEIFFDPNEKEDDNKPKPSSRMEAVMGVNNQDEPPQEPEPEVQDADFESQHADIPI